MKSEKLMEALTNIDPQIIEAAGEAAPPKKLTRRLTSVLVAAAIIASLAVTAFSATSLIYDLLPDMDPRAAERYAPVQKSSEANGIRMEVVAASVNRQAAEVELEFQDLEGQRLGGYLYDTEISFDGIKSLSASKGYLYDEATGKLSCSVSVTELSKKDVRKLTGDNVTFLVAQLDVESVPEDIPVPSDLLQSNVSTFTKMNREILQSTGNVYSLAAGLDVMAMGYVDGKLHVQLRGYALPGYGVPAFSLSVWDNRGNFVHWSDAAVFSYGPDGTELHTEYVFDIPQDSFEGCQLIANVGLVQRIEGPWKVSFPLESVASDYDGPLSFPKDSPE